MDNTKELLAKYSITESRVVLRDILLNKSIKIVDGTAKLPSDGRKKYACTICWKRFLTSKELENHRPTHEKEKEHDGDDVIIVTEKPRKKATLIKRQAKSTPKTVPVKNTIKNYFQKATKKVVKHERPLLSHKCETCDSDFTSIEDIKLHTSSECRFKCGVCHKTYNTVYAFTVHILQHKINLFNTTPAPDKLHKCSLCPESFDDYIDLKTHGILEHKTKSGSIIQDEPESNPDETNGNGKEIEISCELCFDIFESEEELNEHMEFHKELGGKHDKKVQEENSVDTEESSEKQAEDDSPENTKEAPEEIAKECATREVRIELNPIPVIECSYSLAEQDPDTPSAEPDSPGQPVHSPGGSVDSPGDHVDSSDKHVDLSTEPVEDERKEEDSGLKYIVLPSNDMIPKKHYKCNKCERIYTSIEEFDSHIPSGCKMENVCPVCLITISTNSEWYTHITEKHRRWATCKYCFETFNEIKKLDQHKAIKHFNTFKNVCKICYVSFATYEEFDGHLKKEHLNL